MHAWECVCVWEAPENLAGSLGAPLTGCSVLGAAWLLRNLDTIRAISNLSAMLCQIAAEFIIFAGIVCDV